MIKMGAHRKFITYNGHTKTLEQWANETGVHIKTLYYRLRQGYSPNLILGIQKYPNIYPNDSVSQEQINDGVESWHLLMKCRGFNFRKERIQSYKQLKKDYEYFKKQGMQVAA